jgi:hypothetical protein
MNRRGRTGVFGVCGVADSRNKRVKLRLVPDGGIWAGTRPAGNYHYESTPLRLRRRVWRRRLAQSYVRWVPAAYGASVWRRVRTRRSATVVITK